MLAQTLRLALRRLARRPGTTAVHVGGLAVGLGCCFLAMLFVHDELSYDRFHDGADRIVSVQQRVQMGDQTMSFVTLPEGGRAALDDGTTGIEALTATSEDTGIVRPAPGAEGVVVPRIRFADPSFFDVFTFPLRRGDAATVLADPNQVVLTESLAATLFGDADPMGRDVYVERTGFGIQDPAPIVLRVAGVVADPPKASSISFDMLVSGLTPVATYEGTEPALGETSPTYIRLGAVRDTAAVKAALNPLVLRPDAHFADFGEQMGVFTPRLVETHLRGAAQGGALVGKPLYLVLFSSVALLILLLACANYANLATALALCRATEVGVRKTLGAGRGELARQFLVEAVLLALVAGVVGVALVAAVLPAFNAFFDKGVALDALGPAAWAVALGLALGAGLLAGAYPALVQARFRPVTALRGTVTPGGRTSRVRQSLVVFQFAVTAILLASTAVIAQQLDASRGRDLGFRGDRVVTLDLQADRLRQRAGVLEREIEALPGVTRASLGTGIPGDLQTGVRVSTWATNDDTSDDLVMRALQAETDYPETLGLEMLAGRWTVAEDGFSEVAVLNETAARALGLMTTDAAEAIGGQIGYGRNETPVEVVGIVGDFHFEGPRQEIKPLVVQPMTESVNMLSLVVHLASSDARTLDAVREIWERAVPEYPFDPAFVDATFADDLREDRQLGQLFGAFGLVAVVLACLGVFGLAAHAAERRTKEIGIRKVLGASVAGLVARLAGEFARLVVVALVVAAPVTVVLARRWLEGFAYPAPLSAGPFVVVGVGVLALALLAAGVHAVRAATADPARSLRAD